MNKAKLKESGCANSTAYYTHLICLFCRDKKAGIKEFDSLSRRDRKECMCYLVDVISVDGDWHSLAVIALKAFIARTLTFDYMFE